MKIFIIIFFALTALVQLSNCTTILVDGVTEWKNPNVHIGDSIIFKDKYHQYNLYIFQNQEAFNLCNFTQSSLLTKPNSTSFTWHPSRPGLFYFTFDNGSHIPCKRGRKFAIKVSGSTSPMSAPSPPIISGGVIVSSPAYQWPYGSEQPSEAPIANSPDSMPLLPNKGGGFPFIDSNPVVPLPTGEVDSATIMPLSSSSSSGYQNQVVVGLLAAQMPLYITVFLMLLL